ncbi:hypothetical protein RJT34_13447 [Clitoria ternatea]|uniref:Uncharacterized protein n=1 Tax=Clitoria ternatea TaxID=43366 RepID=A0AAN9PK74_CLITE
MHQANYVMLKCTIAKQSVANKYCFKFAQMLPNTMYLGISYGFSEAIINHRLIAMNFAEARCAQQIRIL